MTDALSRRRALSLAFAALALTAADRPRTLVDAIAAMRPSVVGIALFLPLKGGSPALVGSGFAVGDGRHVVTNAHVVAPRDEKVGQIIFVLVENGARVDRRRATVVAALPEADLVLLRMDSGAALTPVRLREEVELAPEGTEVAMTGFPIGAVLGFYPVTHRGIVAARTTNFSALPSERGLTPEVVRGPRFQIYQLDLVAYPGNSGSALYEVATGAVLGVVSAVALRSTKEKALSEPSGITYAIPSGFIRELLVQAKLTP
jgi:S1-C subfamily serine protease